MTTPPRFVTVLVPLQLVTLLIGFAICRKMVRFSESFAELIGTRWQQPLPLRAMSEMGGLLLLLPIAWGVAACLRAESVGPVMEVRSLDSKLGIALLAGLAWLSFWAAVQSAQWAFGPHW